MKPIIQVEVRVCQKTDLSMFGFFILFIVFVPAGVALLELISDTIDDFKRSK